MLETKVKECDLGLIRYRMPNVVEMTNLQGVMGMSAQSEKAKKMAQESELVWMARLMGEMGPMIVAIEAEKDGEPIVHFQDALQHPEFYVPFRDIAGEIFVYIMQAQGLIKKKPSAPKAKAAKRKPAKKAASRRKSRG